MEERMRELLSKLTDAQKQEVWDFLIKLRDGDAQAAEELMEQARREANSTGEQIA